MRIGFFTVCLANMEFKEVVEWAAKTGFNALEVECYENSKHVNVDKLDENRIREIKDVAKKNDIFISDLSYAPNNLDPDEKKRKRNQEHLKKSIDACAKLNVDTITTFVGRDPTKDVEENLEIFEREFGPLVDYAKDRNVKLAIENCPMGFYGGGNLAYSPQIWKRMFKMFGPTLGLCYDPSHLLWQQIDVVQPIREFIDRIYIVHAKDCEVDKNILNYGGILNSEWVDVLFTGKTGIGHRKIKWEDPTKQWWRYRIPGLGEINFKAIFSELSLRKWDHVTIIEHEDPMWYGTEELNKQGLKIGLRYLSQFFP